MVSSCNHGNAVRGAEEWLQEEDKSSNIMNIQAVRFSGTEAEMARMDISATSHGDELPETNPDGSYLAAAMYHQSMWAHGGRWARA